VTLTFDYQPCVGPRAPDIVIFANLTCSFRCRFLSDVVSLQCCYLACSSFVQYKLSAGTHVPDIVLTSDKESTSFVSKEGITE
jgi:hypothetical protein